MQRCTHTHTYTHTYNSNMSRFQKKEKRLLLYFTKHVIFYHKLCLLIKFNMEAILIVWKCTFTPRFPLPWSTYTEAREPCTTSMVESTVQWGMICLNGAFCRCQNPLATCSFGTFVFLSSFLICYYSNFLSSICIYQYELSN